MKFFSGIQELDFLGTSVYKYIKKKQNIISNRKLWFRLHAKHCVILYYAWIWWRWTRISMYLYLYVCYLSTIICMSVHSKIHMLKPNSQCTSINRLIMMWVLHHHERDYYPFKKLVMQIPQRSKIGNSTWPSHPLLLGNFTKWLKTSYYCYTSVQQHNS